MVSKYFPPTSDSDYFLTFNDQDNVSSAEPEHSQLVAQK